MLVCTSKIRVRCVLCAISLGGTSARRIQSANPLWQKLKASAVGGYVTPLIRSCDNEVRIAIYEMFYTVHTATRSNATYPQVCFKSTLNWFCGEQRNDANLQRQRDLRHAAIAAKRHPLRNASNLVTSRERFPPK
jgi:hypothetical protein